MNIFGEERRELNGALLLIGDEIISGRIQDENLKPIATFLDVRAGSLAETRIVGDERAAITQALRDLLDRHDLVFVCGGTGPTHDDVTVDCVAEVFGVDLVQNEELRRSADQRWPGPLSTARHRMTLVPQGARLIAPAASGIPGFSIGNAIILPGVPKLVVRALSQLAEVFPPATPTVSEVVHVPDRDESAFADALSVIASQHPEVTIGSYPKSAAAGGGIDIVVRSRTARQAVAAADALRASLSGTRTD